MLNFWLLSFPNHNANGIQRFEEPPNYESTEIGLEGGSYQNGQLNPKNGTTLANEKVEVMIAAA